MTAIDEKEIVLDGAYREFMTIQNKRLAAANIRQCGLRANYMTENEREEQERLEEQLPEPEYSFGRGRMILKVIAALLMGFGALTCVCGIALFFLIALLAEPSAYRIGIAGLLGAFAGLVFVWAGWIFWRPLS